MIAVIRDLMPRACSPVSICLVAIYLSPLQRSTCSVACAQRSAASRRACPKHARSSTTPRSGFRCWSGQRGLWGAANGMPSFWQELLGGTAGGVVGMTVVYPLDTVKSRLQTSGRSRYSSIANVLTTMARSEGTMSLYRGLLSPVVGYGAMFAISFSSYGHAGRFLLRRRGADEKERLTLSEMGLAGAYAGLMNAPMRQVFERVKGVMQVRHGEKRKPPYSWSGACAVDLVRREGVAMGLFRGMGATMLREPVQFAIYYPVYEIVKGYLMSPNRTRTGTTTTGLLPDPVLQMLAGGVAGCVHWLPPVYWLDVVKTRLQTAEPGVYKGVWDCYVKTVRAEGYPVLFRGVGAAMLRAFPMHGLVFLGYETTIGILGASPRAATNSYSQTSAAAASFNQQGLE